MGRPKKSDATLESIVTAPAAAAIFGVQPQWIRDLVIAGHIVKNERDQYRLGDIGRGVVKYYKDNARRSQKNVGAAKVQDARSRQIELKIAIEQGRLVDIEDVMNVFAEACVKFRSELDGIPAAVTRDLTLRKVIEKQINDAIDRIRGTLEKAQDADWGSADSVLEGEEADA